MPTIVKWGAYYEKKLILILLILLCIFTTACNTSNKDSPLKETSNYQLQIISNELNTINGNFEIYEGILNDFNYEIACEKMNTMERFSNNTSPNSLRQIMISTSHPTIITDVRIMDEENGEFVHDNIKVENNRINIPNDILKMYYFVQIEDSNNNKGVICFKIKNSTKYTEPERTDGLHLYKSIEYGEGSPERLLGIKSLILLTDAPKDEDGVFSWDDGHMFSLRAVTDSKEIDIIPLSYFQISSIEFESFFKLDENVFCVLVHIPAGASYNINEYVFNKDMLEFSENIIYQVNNINNLSKTSYTQFPYNP